jgi:hypothetical protein
VVGTGLLLENGHQVGAGFAILNDWHDCGLQQIGPLCGSQMERCGIAGLVKRESAAAVHVVPAAEKDDALRQSIRDTTTVTLIGSPRLRMRKCLRSPTTPDKACAAFVRV